MGPETALECVRCAVWGMLYADDACIVSQSPRLGLMMAVIVKVCGAFGLTVSEKKTKTMLMPIPHGLLTLSTTIRLPRLSTSGVTSLKPPTCRPRSTDGFARGG